MPEPSCNARSDGRFVVSTAGWYSINGGRPVRLTDAEVAAMRERMADAVVVEFDTEQLPRDAGGLCDLRCWQATTCTVCHRQKAPRGRSLPLATAGAYCDDDRCPGYLPNGRHLWDEHDDARHYTDPGGWANHVANCDRCGPDDDDS